MIQPLNAKGEPMPLTEVPTFEPGHGRPDLDMLHRVIHMLDREERPYYIREAVANYLVARPDDTINNPRLCACGLPHRHIGPCREAT